MTRIEGALFIGRPVDVVFDYVADPTNEPQYNPKMVRVEKETAGPIGRGTRFRSAVRSAGRTAEMRVEFVGYERPRLLVSSTRMKQMDVDYRIELEPVPRGTRMRWTGDVRPKGGFRLLGPLVSRMGNRQEQRIWSSMKSRLENTGRSA